MTSDYTNERKLEELKVLKKKKEIITFHNIQPLFKNITMKAFKHVMNI